MKISKIFHFLYFSVLSIPLISMPIFAIYSQNHEITGYEVTQEVNKKLDFNQNMPMPSNDTITTYASGSTSTFSNNEIYLNNAIGRDGLYLNSNYRANIKANDIVYYRFEYLTVEQINWQVSFSYNSERLYRTLEATNTYTLFEVRHQYTQDSKYLFDLFPNTYGVRGSIYVRNINFFNLTQMYGSGNEPTIEQFNTTFTSNYYEYTLSREVVIENYETITYNDTDIGSQFIYNEYNFMDKYLGIYKFSPFNDIYQWLQNTFFGGAAPMVFTIFYQWFAYWLFVSLCWLIFDVLMYVPLMIHRWLDKAEL